MEQVWIWTDEAMTRHDPGSSHPDAPARLSAVRAGLATTSADVKWKRPTSASPVDLVRVHTEEHLKRLDRLRGKSGSLDPDTHVSPASVDAAWLAAGAAVNAVDAVLRGDIRRGFAAVRPPGHHAEANRAMGFCLLNNVAIAAEYAIRTMGTERVLVVDWDVHHGNGTQSAFYNRPDVMVLNIHQFPFYPGTGTLTETGRDDGTGTTLNVPLPRGLGDEAWLAAITELLPRAAAKFKPELILISAGFDGHRADPVGGMNLSAEGYGAMCGVVSQVANEHCGGKLVGVLEGGYDLKSLGECARATVEVMGGSIPAAVADPRKSEWSTIKVLTTFHEKNLAGAM